MRDKGSQSKYAVEPLRVVPPDTAPLAELCRPLSAKVMPRAALLGYTGDPAEVGALMGSQRRLPGLSAKERKKGKK